MKNVLKTAGISAAVSLAVVLVVLWVAPVDVVKDAAFGGPEFNRVEGSLTTVEIGLSAASSSVVLQQNHARGFLHCNNSGSKTVWLHVGSGNATLNRGFMIPSSSSYDFEPSELNITERIAAISNAVATVSCTYQ